MASLPPNVLIIDDDPLHITLYTWMIRREGFNPVGAVVHSNAVEWPEKGEIDVVLLDYRLNSALTAPQVARMVRERYPTAPILVLSEMPWLPDDMRPHADGFISKGEPAHLMKALAGAIAAGR